MASLFGDLALPMQKGGAGDPLALVIEHYTGIVREQMDRLQVLKPFVNFIPLNGTNVISTRAFGKTAIAKRTADLVGSVLPTTTDAKAGKNTLMVEAVLYARHAIDVWQEVVSDWDYWDRLAKADGIEWAKLYDQACIIQAGRAAKMTTSAHPGVSMADGHGGGNIVTFDAVGDGLNGNKILDKLIDLIVKFNNRDIDPTNGFMLICRPEQFWALAQADKLINTDFLTSSGQNMTNMPVLKTFGIPVVQTLNLPNTNISAHPLNTTENGQAFNVDFSDMPFLLCSQDALLAAEVLPLTVNYHKSDDALAKLITSYASFSVGVDNPRMAGAILRAT